MSIPFKDLGVIEPLQKALEALGITTPTDIQQKAIPALLTSKKDLVALARTGSGKTIAFGLPLLQLIDRTNPTIQAVIVVPTRELGQQIQANMESFAAQMPNVTIAAICGGVPIKAQIERLTQPTQIVVATPGRLIDLMNRNAINIKNANYLVIDEADEMISSLGDGLDKIVKELPNNRRTALFSATMPATIKQMIQKYMSKDVIQIELDINAVGKQDITHQFVVVEPIEKLNVLMHFLNSRIGQRGIIFCKTKAAVNKLAKNLAINKFSSGALHGSLSQPIRDRIMGQFREGHIDILVATDLAARGIDVKEIAYVVHYHLPDVYQVYTHRSGRTARAGVPGYALTILQKEEAIEIKDFEEELGVYFTEYQKADAQSLEENSSLLWAKQIFKTKLNQNLSKEFREKMHTVFHHLSKEELIDKLIAHKHPK